jgi:oligoendopeptidase F
MPKENKYSGAYSIGGTFGLSRFFILMNFDGTLRSVETLAHELGHSINSYYFGKEQPPVYNETTIFTAEVASICNENIFHDYLLEKHKGDKFFEIEILTKIISGFFAASTRQVIFSNFE